MICLNTGLKKNGVEMTLLNRWFIYLHEVFKPLSRLVFSLILYCSIQMMMMILNGEKSISLTFDIIPASITLTLALLYYRVSDEFKDAETDRKFFPERPVPSGRVSLNDLKKLLYLTLFTAFTINIIWNKVFFIFLALFGFAFLMRHWFFLEKLISANRLYAFFSHAPISILGNFFIIGVYCKNSGTPLFSEKTIFCALFFALSGYAWEIARKTRAPHEEVDGYQTYSQILGFKISALWALLFVVGEAFMVFLYAEHLLFSAYLILWILINTVAYAFIIFYFILYHKKGSSFLQPASELHTALIYIPIIVEFAMRYGVKWQ